MNITNLEMTQATIEIFGGFICFMLAVIIMMNGDERKSWKQLKSGINGFWKKENTMIWM